jgi:hypothetical protein
MCKQTTLKQVPWARTICRHCGREIITLGYRGRRLCGNCQREANRFYTPYRKVTQEFRLKVTP